MYFATLENESDSFRYKKRLCQLMLLVYPATKRPRTGRRAATSPAWPPAQGGTWCPSLMEGPSRPPQETLFCTGDGSGRQPRWKEKNLGPGPALGQEAGAAASKGMHAEPRGTRGPWEKAAPRGPSQGSSREGGAHFSSGSCSVYNEKLETGKTSRNPYLRQYSWNGSKNLWQSLWQLRGG